MIESSGVWSYHTVNVITETDVQFRFGVGQCVYVCTYMIYYTVNFLDMTFTLT